MNLRPSAHTLPTYLGILGLIKYVQVSEFNNYCGTVLISANSILVSSAACQNLPSPLTMALEVETRSALPSALPATGPGAEIRGKQRWTIPASDWTHEIHPCAEKVSKEVDDYFLQNWDFPDDRARSIFLKAGFSHVTCLYFPLAKNERIHFACRLLTVLFLIDGMLNSRFMTQNSSALLG